MGGNFRALVALTRYYLHRVAYAAFVLFAIAMIAATVLSATGYWPWLRMSAGLGEQAIENAGQYVQIGVAVLAVMLLFFLPAARRTMALEAAHRDFRMGIEDVARAYHHAHAADRSSAFQLSAEFDSMRERLAYLRDHPDLGALEPEVLELAAQMSFISRELAETYSDDNVGRARAFLRQRQQEVERFNKRIVEAKAIHQELKHWLTQVELEESVAASQLERLRDELLVIMPEMGVEQTARRRKVIDLPRPAE